MRVSELNNLKVEDIKELLQTGQLLSYQQKTKNGRLIVVDSTGKKYIKKVIDIKSQTNTIFLEDGIDQIKNSPPPLSLKL